MRVPKTWPSSIYARPLLRTQNCCSLPCHPRAAGDAECKGNVGRPWLQKDCRSGCICWYSSWERLERESGDKGRIGADGGAERKPPLTRILSGFLDALILAEVAISSFSRLLRSKLRRLGLSTSASDFGSGRLILRRPESASTQNFWDGYTHMYNNRPCVDQRDEIFGKVSCEQYCRYIRRVREI